MQISIKIHGKRRSAVSHGHYESMTEILENAKGDKLSNIYSEDESRLLYHMGPSQSYLSTDESRNEA